jgi:hypothetical protein
MTRVLVPMFVLAASVCAGRAAADDCGHRGDREAALDTGGVRSVRIEAGAGELRVEGRTGQTRVEATGVACASSESVLGQIRLTATRDGNVIVIKTEIPDGSGAAWNDAARLDLTVIVPRILPIDVEDGSGSATIVHVGPATIHDGSGDLTVKDVVGDLRIEDGSGEIDVEKVTGNVRLSDGSGGITVRDVGGSVTVDDDGSGGIDVAGVKGDFTVKTDGSGGITHRAIAGQVHLPSDRRDR